ncbi:MAG: helix-turn-helix domain-containing protein [Rhizobiaceae bacterium]|nr:helix-turn-helix domain-containing protein [Rhizobiaceae bacterium]MCZ8349840.1 helix-turn-helix domain-containing protein [Rhizobium sp.]
MESIEKFVESKRVPGLALLTTEQAAEALTVSVAYLHKLRVTGGGPRFIRMGRAVRYRASDLLEWVNDRAVSSTSEGEAA